jgi:hypothetical protein
MGGYPELVPPQGRKEERASVVRSGRDGWMEGLAGLRRRSHRLRRVDSLTG